nr:transposase [Brachybacterium paraconglomeratum]
MPAPYSQEFRDDVVRVARSREDGVTLAQIAKDFGVDAMTLHNWLRQSDVEAGVRAGTTREDAAETRELKRRVRLLKQLAAATQIRQFRRFLAGLARPGTVLDIGLAHPVRQTGFGDPEVFRDPGELLARFTVSRDSHDVVTELVGIGSGHGPHPYLRRSSAPQLM